MRGSSAWMSEALCAWLDDLPPVVLRFQNAMLTSIRLLLGRQEASLMHSRPVDVMYLNDLSKQAPLSAPAAAR